MKRLIVTNREQTKLLQDDINRTIVKNLIERELSASDLARVLHTSVVKAWRRIKILERNGLVEQSNRKLVANLEKKMYRSKAVSHVAEDSFDLKPKNKAIIQAYQKSRQIRSEAVRILQNANEVPSDISPIDYAIATELYAMCTIYLKPETQARIRSILEDLLDSDILNLSGRANSSSPNLPAR